MLFKRTQKFFFLLICMSLTLGFRVYPNRKWSVDMTTTAHRKVFVTLTGNGSSIPNNLPSTDALSSTGSTLTEAQLLSSILDDYNAISDSALMLVTDSDSDFANYSRDHRIYIEPGSATGASSGEAQPTFSGGAFSSCKILLTSKAYVDAKTYVALVTHELGHCVGLEHPQDTENSVMSYFKKEDIYRLAIDDKMGIVHLYAKDPAGANEQPTYGLSCNRK